MQLFSVHNTSCYMWTTIDNNAFSPREPPVGVTEYMCPQFAETASTAYTHTYVRHLPAPARCGAFVRYASSWRF